MAKEKILIVEDERIVAADIRRRLRNMGYVVSATVSSGEEAIRKAEQLKPDLVLMDIVLEGEMNGIKAAEKIRSRFNIPIVYLTAYADDEILEQAKTTGPFGYIVKPVEDDELRSNIEIAIYKSKMEEKLDEERFKLKEYFENLPLLAYNIDFNGTIVDCNRMAVKTLGYKSKDNLVGKPLITTVYAPSSRKKARQLLERWKKESKLRNEELQIITKQGKVIDILLNVDTIFDHNGKPLHSLSTQLDITERKWVGEALLESEEKFRLLSEQNLLGIVIIQDGFVKYVNTAAFQITEYSIEEGLAWKPNEFRKLFHPDDLEFVMEQAQKKQEGAKDVVTHYSCRMITKSGKVKWIDLYSKTITFEGRSADLITIIDISERKRAEEAIQIERDRLEAVTQNIGVGLAIISTDYRTLWANAVLKRLFGGVEGKHCYSTYNQRSEICPGCGVREVFEKGKDSVAHEQVGEDAEGKTIWSEIIATPIRDEAGNIISALEVVVPITERKRTEQAIQTSLREKELLLREIHHRVKNNLQVITSLINFQIRYLRDKAGSVSLKELQNRIRSMSLIHEKLYQAKDLARVDFSDYVKDLVIILYQTYGVDRRKIALKMEVKEVALEINFAIPCGLIINELVSNSLKHAFPKGKKGEIDIALYPSGKDEVELVVGDNGVGIPEDVDFRKTETLGLQLVTLLAEGQLHGHIELDKTKGTVFHIKLKVA